MSAAKDYARALFSLTEELGTSDAAVADVRLCCELFKQYPEYPKLVDTPALSVPKKQQLLAQSLATVNESVRNLIMILCQCHSVYMFSEIAKEFFLMYNESRNIMSASVISAVALSDSQLCAMKEKLETMTGKTVQLIDTVDESLLGGVKLRYAGVQLDSSLKTRLLAVEKSLKSTII